MNKDDTLFKRFVSKLLYIELPKGSSNCYVLRYSYVRSLSFTVPRCCLSVGLHKVGENQSGQSRFSTSELFQGKSSCSY